MRAEKIKRRQDRDQDTQREQRGGDEPRAPGGVGEQEHRESERRDDWRESQPCAEREADAKSSREKPEAPFFAACRGDDREEPMTTRSSAES